MSYSYTAIRNELFTEAGTEFLIALRDNVRHLIVQAGAVRAQEAWRKCPASNSWLQLAGMDYLVEKGELREILQDGAPGQHRLFVAGPNFKS